MEANTPPTTVTLAVRIGREIHAEMIRQGLTQEHLANRVDRSQQWVSRRITGRTPVDAADLEEIAEALGVPVAQFWPAPQPTSGGGAR